jgi:hypothetical protein
VIHDRTAANGQQLLGAVERLQPLSMPRSGDDSHHAFHGLTIRGVRSVVSDILLAVGRGNLRTFGFIAVVALLAAAVILVGSTYHILDEGELLEYTRGYVYKVEVLGMFELWAEPEVKPRFDVFNSLMLVSISSMALLAAILLQVVAPGAPQETHRFFLATWVGFGFLGLDELLGVHESIGHNVQFLRELPAVERPDDVVSLLYVVPAMVYLIYFRHTITASPWAPRLFGAALAIFVLAAILELGFGARWEENLEVVGVLVLGAGFVVLFVRLLASALRPAQLAASR